MEADLIFRGATVVDGTGKKAFPADVAVKGGRIAAVGELRGSGAAREVDCSGKVLCPGFVDIHSHSDYYLLILPGADGKVLQGVTTEVCGNCGYSAAPVAGEVAADRRESHKDLYGLDADWTDYAGFLGRLERARPAVNFAGLAGFNTIRGSAGLFSSGRPAPAEMESMKRMLAEAMEAGAFGMSLGLIYPPGVFADVDEISDIAAEAARRGGIVASHMRSEGDRLLEAIEESIEIARQSGAAFQISHLKTSGTANWGKLDRVFELIESARDKGMRITADRYPYMASFTQLSAALPGWVFEGGKDRFFARLADHDARLAMRGELERTDALGDRFERIVISLAHHGDLRKYEGMSVADAAESAGQEPVDFLCDFLIKARDRAAATYHTMSTGNLERILQKDWVMAGSDAAARSASGPLSEGKPHPRAYGTMPRMIAWAWREKKWIGLEAAVRKMTADPCDVLGIADRGRVQQGLMADLVLFDPETIRDTATYEKPQQYPEGIDMVVVNGAVAAENGQLTGERNGMVLRSGE